jgi:hypothetical protein
MNFRDLSEEQRRAISDLMFEPLSSAQEVKNWVKFYLGLEIPLEITDPDSTSSPLDAVWQIYKVFKENSGDVTPGAIIMSCREGMKTVSVSILEVLLLLHFELDIAHAAATEAQSFVGIKYIESFIRSVEVLMEARGWTNITQNKRTIQYKTPKGAVPYIKVLICTPKGMNSLHTNVLFLDELDLADPASIKEGKNIVGYSKGIFGMTVYLSTRKYAFGNVQLALDKAQEMNYKVFQWNILDVCEACPPTRYLPNGTKIDKYVAKNLPLVQLTKEEFDQLPDTEKPKYDFIPNSHAGCSKCTIFPVCRGNLAIKPATATGGFYKPIVSVIQKFKENDADMAESQLLCWKPGSEGLVFPRFSRAKIRGNVINVVEAYNTLTGGNRTNVSFDMLVNTIRTLDISLYAGVDWGFTHDTVIVIVAKMPNDEIWVLDCFASPGLEFSDVLEVAVKYRDRYGVSKWFCDQAMPSHIKSFNKNWMKSPAFTKDVIGGIEAIRSKIVSATGKRLFKVIDTEKNKKVVDAITKHRFLLDGQGNSTPKPDDEPGVADICDALRYIGQNLFPIRGPQKVESVWVDNKGTAIDPNSPEAKESAIQSSIHENQMKQEIANRLGPGPVVITTGKKGGFSFSV